MYYYKTEGKSSIGFQRNYKASQYGEETHCCWSSCTVGSELGASVFDNSLAPDPVDA